MSFQTTIDSGRFRRWLAMKAEFERDGHVGFAASEYDNPIAYYLESTRGASLPSVTGEEIQYQTRSGRTRTIQTPRWVGSLLEVLDTRFEGARVRASQVITVLDEIKP